MADGAKFKKVKKYTNDVHRPLLTVYKIKKVLELVNISGLHKLLELTNYLYCKTLMEKIILHKLIGAVDKILKEIKKKNSLKTKVVGYNLSNDTCQGQHYLEFNTCNKLLETINNFVELNNFLKSPWLF